MKQYCIHCMREMIPDNRLCNHCGKEQKADVPEQILLPGTVLNGKYFVGLPLGQGGFGITYIGRDFVLDRLVAIKEYYPFGMVSRNHAMNTAITVLPSENAFFGRGKYKFLDEAKTLAKFSGEAGIVGVMDFFECNNTAYIVMEYLDGVTLSEHLKKNGTLTPDQMLDIMRPVMISLEKVHKEGIIHRDISPSNIMMVEGKIKLIDFGAFRNTESNATRSISATLKPGYAPEEQYRLKGEQGPWTDVYALCATMYRCITGKTPEESIERAHNDTLMLPSEIGCDVSPGFEKVLMKGLAVVYTDRIQNINELLEAFDKSIEEAYHPVKKKSKLPAVIIAVFGVVIAAGVIVLSASGAFAGKPEENEPVSVSSSKAAESSSETSILIPLTNKSMVISETIQLGNKVRMLGFGMGGTGEYTYSYYFKYTQNTKWEILAENVEKDSSFFEPVRTGEYDARIVVHDSSGARDERLFKITVVKEMELTNVSTPDSGTIPTGEIVTLIGRAVGGKQPYTFAFYYKKSGEEEWNDLGEGFSKTALKDWMPPAAGVYDVNMIVNDATGKSVDKVIQVTVTE